MDNKKHLFELKKENILNNFKNGKKEDPALAYALENDCYPFFHEEFEGFEDMFGIQLEFEKTFYEYIDELYTQKNYKTFYEIQRKFHDIHKFTLIVMLKYAVLTDRFSGDDFKNTLLSSGQYPVEASAIFKPIEE